MKCLLNSQIKGDEVFFLWKNFPKQFMHKIQLANPNAHYKFQQQLIPDPLWSNTQQ